MKKSIYLYPVLFLILVIPVSVQAQEQANNLTEEVEALQSKLADAVRKYEAGETSAAIRTTEQLFMDFESSNYDQELSTRDHGFYLKLEKKILALKNAMVDPGSRKEVNDLAKQIKSLLNEGLQKISSPLSLIAVFLQSVIIILREGLEALLILAVVVLVLRRTSQEAQVRTVYTGAGLGIAASLVLAALLATLLQQLAAGQALIEGASMLLAVPVLFSVSYWLIAMAQVRNWKSYIQNWVETAGKAGRSWAIISIAFLVVFREGAETVLFYQALWASAPNGLGAIALGFASGVVLLTITWLLTRRMGVQIPLRPFFIITSTFLYIMAFRFAGKGILELQEAGILGFTTVQWLPVGSWFQGLLNIYPYWEPLAAQLTLALALIVGLIYSLGPRLKTS